MLVYSTNLVFSFLNYIYVWGNSGETPFLRIRASHSAGLTLPTGHLEPSRFLSPWGNITASTCRGSRVNCRPPERRLREGPVDSGARQTAGTPRISSGRGRTRLALGLVCAGARERLERSIIGRAKNVTLGKGGRREVGKHVSLNPLPVPPVQPWISSSWRQTAATHQIPGRQYAHTRAHTRTLTRPAASCTLQTSA